MLFSAQGRSVASSSLRCRPALQALVWFFLLVSAPFASAATITTLTVTSAAAPVTTVPAQSVITLTAAVLNGASPVTMGQINFCDASAPACTDIHLLGTAQLTSAGTAIMQFVPGIGTHRYQAVFVGTNATPGSASAVSSLQVTAVSPYRSTTTLVSSGSAGNYSLTGTVVRAAGLAAPVGTLSFLDTTSSNAPVATAELSPILGFSSSNLPVGQTPTLEAVGDFNGDGRTDLAVITNPSFVGAVITVYLGNGDGTFTAASPVTLPAGQDPGALITGDFNGDGKLDLIVSLIDDNSGDESLLVLLGVGDGTFTTGAEYSSVASASSLPSTSPGKPVVGDLNGDGKLDLALPDPGGREIVLFLGNGDGTFNAGTSFLTGDPAYGDDYPPISLAIGDFNGDGKEDLAVLDSIVEDIGDIISVDLHVFAGNGDGTFGAPSSITTPLGDFLNALSIVTGDFNGDGKADMIVASDSATYRAESLNLTVLEVLLGNGDGTFVATQGAVTGLLNNLTAAGGDFNGDGIADIAVSGEIFLGKGDGSFSAFAPANDEAGAYFAVGDFNGDGASDLAVSNGSAFTIELAQQTATATATSVSPVGTGVHQVEASFAADGTYSASVSGTIGLTAVPATTLTLSASPSTVSVSQSVALTATLSPYTASGHASDGESVSFTQNGASLGTAILAGGVAVLNTTSLAPGNDTLQAAYPTDGTLASSTSNTLSYLVSIPSQINFAIPNHVYGDLPFLLAATSNSTGELTYSLVSGPATIAGATISITGAGTIVVQVAQAAAGAYSATTQTASGVVSPAPLTVAVTSTARVFGAPNPAFVATVTGAANGDTFNETFATPATAASIVGSYPVVPSITGAHIADYSVAGIDGTLTVTQAGTVTTFALSNQNTTLTASVAALTSGQPTGAVNFYEGQTLVGSGMLSNGVASYTAGALPGGDVVVSAQYSGDANFTQSASPPILVLAAAPASPSLTVSQAGSVSDTISLSPAPGYTGTAQLSCAGLPVNAVCSFQPASVSFTGAGGAVSVGLTIQTGVAAQASLLPFSREQGGAPGGLLAVSLWAPGFFAAVLAGLRRPGLRVPPRFARLLLLACLALPLCACGGGASSPSPAPGSAQTPTGTTSVQVVVAGSNGLSQTLALNLTVQ